MSEARLQQPPFGLRMPESLKTHIRMKAESNKRSMNAEILYILERAVRNEAATDVHEQA